LTGLDYSILQIKTKIVSCHTANFKPVKQEVNGKVILPPLVFPGQNVKDNLIREESFTILKSQMMVIIVKRQKVEFRTMTS
jgi:hypothetical protein